MSEETSKFIHAVEIQSRFNDFDVLGHVNNAVYQHYYDFARIRYFKDVIGANIDWLDFSVIMASIKIEYKFPIQMNETVWIRSRMKKIGEKSLLMVQEIYNPLTGETKSCNQATMVGYSPRLKQTMPIPAIWKEKIFAYETEVEYKYSE
ncbi:MAG: acyl-CoA thioesterase [Bacteroidales bacterium]|nr:acyl-CoA thioesterase [Bacteroidales bacterium]MCF8389127.1 acyl-CoA thioesterase [Bacteroidales bacterium]